ncbi:MAG: hypothetical protein JW780_00295 [Clostridiales bacterium]|nr:hypothetical protein [Clostridiales bacterium]
MFSLFRRKREAKREQQMAEETSKVTDTTLIAVISAAIACYRDRDPGASPAVGFVVRRVRRV